MLRTNNNQNNRSSLLAAVALAAAPVLMSASAAMARPAINYFTGFEPAPFNNGDPVPSVGTLNGWYRQDGAPTATALPGVFITNTQASAGVQSMTINNAPPFNQADPGSVTYSISPVGSLAGANDLVANGTPYVHVQVDMMVQDGADIDDTSDWFQMDVYDSTANVLTASVLRTAIAAVPGGAPTSAAVYTTLPNGQINPAPVGAGANSGVWGTYALDLDYVTHTFVVSLNNVPLTLPLPMNVAANDGMDINFTVSGRGIDAAYFDNFSVSAVPEPTTVAALGLATTGLLARRRRRNG